MYFSIKNWKMRSWKNRRDEKKQSQKPSQSSVLASMANTIERTDNRNGWTTRSLGREPYDAEPSSRYKLLLQLGTRNQGATSGEYFENFYS